MLIELASHNDDIRRLLDRGYALREDSAHLVVRDIPYLDENGDLAWGAIVTKLVLVDRVRVQQHDHQVYFSGSVPYGLNNQPIPNLGGGAKSISLIKDDVIVQRSFSNKPRNSAGALVPFADFFDKIEHYVRLISGPAIEKFNVTPLTFRVDDDVIGDSVFKFRDTLSSRAEIGDLSRVFKDDVVAIIGLGGTGAYVLDFLVKTPVKEIRGFDGDAYHVHNAFRSPGKLEENDLGQGKTEVYQGRYENFRTGLTLHHMYIDRSSASELEGVTFAFVCVDKGSARAEIFDLLMELGIPFIDVGMGLNRKQGPLAGTIRTTYYSVENVEHARQLRLAEMADDPNDEYRTQVQISELNALNACLAVVRFKQIRGFYLDDDVAFHLLMGVENLHMFGMRS